MALPTGSCCTLSATPAHCWPGVRAGVGRRCWALASQGAAVRESECAHSAMALGGNSLMANVFRCRTHDSRTNGLACLLGDLPSKNREPKHRQGGGLHLSRVSSQCRLAFRVSNPNITEQGGRGLSADISTRNFCSFALRGCQVHLCNESCVLMLG